MRINFIGFCKTALSTEYFVANWNDEKVKMCCLVIYRNGLHYLDEDRISLLLNDNKTLLDCRAAFDDYKKQFNLHGPFEKPQGRNSHLPKGHPIPFG